MLKYWNRLIKLDDNRLIKKMFNWNFSLASNVNYINWSYEVRAILSSVDKECVFLTKSACDLINCEQPHKENDINQWFVDVSSKPKLRTYVKFNTEFKPESYVVNFTTKYIRSTLAKI